MFRHVIYEEFAGPGGWDEGLRMLGNSTPIVGVEFSTHACTTARNAGHTRIHADVRTQDLRDVKGPTGHLSSPPCQTFSTMGTGHGRAALSSLAYAARLVLDGASIEDAMERTHDEALDERTTLVLRPLLVARETEPTWIALEQVPNVQPLWDVYAALLRAVGYRVATGVLSAERYGVAQTRRRAVLLAHRGKNVSLPMPTHSAFHPRDPEKLDPGTLPWISMAEALGPDWTPEFNDQSGTAYDARWPWKRPATAVAGRGLVQNPGTTANRFNGATKSRNDGVRVSVSQASLLQSFPADYPFAGTLSAQFQQVGDAIPPLLAAAILRQLIGKEQS